MAFSVSAFSVSTPGSLQNVTSAGLVQQRGQLVCGEVDIDSYDNGGHVITSAQLGLDVIYGAMFLASEVDTYAVRSVVVAAGGKSLTLNVDTAGSGTEVSAATDIGKHFFIAFGQALGSGNN